MRTARDTSEKRKFTERLLDHYSLSDLQTRAYYWVEVEADPANFKRLVRISGGRFGSDECVADGDQQARPTAMATIMAIPNSWRCMPTATLNQ